MLLIRNGRAEESSQIVDFKPVVQLLLCIVGAVFAFSLGAFLIYHLYLSS